MIILSGVTAVLCAENPTGGKWVSYLPLSYRKAWPTHTVPDYLCCRPTQPVHRAPLSLDTSTKTSFQKIFPIPFSQFCSQRAQRHNTDKQLWVLSPPPPPQHFPASLSSPGFPATRSFSEVKIPLQYASG